MNRQMTALATLLALETAPAIAADYRDIAACVYKGLDAQSPGNFRITTLPREVIITFEVHGGGMTIQAMKATFSADGRIDVEGQPPGYYPKQVRPLAAQCGART